MKVSASTLDKIASAAVDQLRTVGAANLTVGSVARAAGISTALVHYHFASKVGLLRVAAGRIAAGRTDRRIAPLTHRGLDAVDALRMALEHDAETGAERAWHDVLLLAREEAEIHQTVQAERDRERTVVAARLPALLGSLGAAPAADVDQLASLLIAGLDGLALGLEAGTPLTTFRSAYDAFWLALIGGGSRRASR